MNKLILSLVFLIFFSLPAKADITTNLICQYKFNDGSGTTAIDSAGTCGNGTLAGTTPPSWTTGYIGTGAINNTVGTGGGGGYVSTPNSVLGSHTNFTFAAWVNPTSLTGQSGHNVFVGGNGSNHWLEVNSSGHFVYHDYSNIEYEDTGTTLSTGTWYHLAVTCKDLQSSSSVMTMYLNGSQVKQITGTTVCYGTTAEKYYWGTIGNVAGSYGFTGKIDEGRIYTRELSSTDIADLYAYTEGGGGGVVKTLNGIDYANIKTINGIAVGSIKTRNGLATQ